MNDRTIHNGSFSIVNNNEIEINGSIVSLGNVKYIKKKNIWVHMSVLAGMIIGSAALAGAAIGSSISGNDTGGYAAVAGIPVLITGGTLILTSSRKKRKRGWNYEIIMNNE